MCSAHHLGGNKNDDPITAGIIVVLSKYAIDQGAGLIKEVGPAAAKKAGELLQTALDTLRGSPKGELVAGGFEEDPETYEKPLAKELETAVQIDPDFAARLDKLWAEYQEAAKAYVGGELPSEHGRWRRCCPGRRSPARRRAGGEYRR